MSPLRARSGHHHRSACICDHCRFSKMIMGVRRHFLGQPRGAVPRPSTTRAASMRTATST